MVKEGIHPHAVVADCEVHIWVVVVVVIQRLYRSLSPLLEQEWWLPKEVCRQTLGREWVGSDAFKRKLF